MSANLTAPPSATSFNHGRAERPQNPWIYKGPDAAKNHRLIAEQAWYAITMRRQLAERLLRDSPEPSKAPIWSDEWQRTVEWNTIRTALKREISRCDRAQKRLAGKKAVAACAA